MKWLAMMLERFGIPPLFGLYDPSKYGATQLSDQKTIFETLQAATSCLIPRAPATNAGDKTLELWVPELAGQVSQAFVPAFDMLDKQLARSILMPGMLSLTSDQGGSYARAKVAFDVFMLVVVGHPPNAAASLIFWGAHRGVRFVCADRRAQRRNARPA